MDDQTGGVSRRKPTRRRTAAELGDPQAEQRTREIEAEIQETRAELSETIDAIQDKLRPSNIVADATERVKTATTEKVKSMADTAGETAQNVMHSTRETASDLMEGARQNPIPALMIGAGVAWLLIDRGRRQDEGLYTSRAARPWTSETHRSGVYEGSGDHYRSSASLRGDDTGLPSATSGYESDYGTDGYASGYGGGYRTANLKARQGARQVQTQLQRLLQDNPLLVGAAAVLVGAAVGAALPETERENELMGETRDNLVERAQQLTSDAVDQVGDAVGGDSRTDSSAARH